MRIAIISDIHSNLEALKATLEDIKKRNVDKIFCLGDIIAKGVHPQECIELIKSNCNVVLRGNCDRHFSYDYIIENFPEVEQKRILWNQSLLTKYNRAYLLNLPFCYEFYLSGSLIRLFHAHPEADKITVTQLDSLETKYRMFKPSNRTYSQKTADVVIYGHIHHPFIETFYNKTLINVGSVGNSFEPVRNQEKDGNPMETTRCTYLIIEGEYDAQEYTSDISFQLIKVPYNMRKELQNDIPNYERQLYEYELLEGTYRNQDKLNKYFLQLGINP